MAQPKVAVQPPAKRTGNFHEVALGYPKKVALDEARRCPQCTEPVCMTGCPLGIDIPGFIRLLREGQTTQAYQRIRESNPLPGVCGRICSAPCEQICILTDEGSPIGIRALERYVADFGKPRSLLKEKPVRKGKKVAVIGSGPAGLAAAAVLAGGGFQVTIFEAMEEAGGVLRYGVPEFRLPRKALDSEIDQIRALGVDIQTSVLVGKTLSFADLRTQGFAAILLTTGAGVPQFMDIPGDHLGAVYYGEEFLMRMNLETNPRRPKAEFILGERIAVIGSGNTALDCARCARRLGKDVTLVFRRTEDEMRVHADTRELAQEEGVRFEALTRPVQILGDNNDFASGLKCIRMDYADVGGKWELKEVPDSEFMLDVDTVVIAVGHHANTYLAQEEGAKITKRQGGTIKVSPTSLMTSLPDVFAAGNAVTGAGPVVDAIASGKAAAEKIDQYLKSKVSS